MFRLLWGLCYDWFWCAVVWFFDSGLLLPVWVLVFTSILLVLLRLLRVAWVTDCSWFRCLFSNCLCELYCCVCCFRVGVWILGCCGGVVWIACLLVLVAYCLCCFTCLLLRVAGFGYGVGYLVVRVGVVILRVGLVKICCDIGWMHCLVGLLGLCILLASCPCWFWFCGLVFGFDVGFCVWWEVLVHGLWFCGFGFWFSVGCDVISMILFRIVCF